MDNSLFDDRSHFEFRNTLWLHLLSGLVLFAWVGVLALFIRDAYGPIPFILWYGVALFSFIAIHYVVQAFDQRIQVRIDKQGIADRRNSFGVIPWAEIAELKLGRRRSQWLMMLRVAHRDFIVDRATPLDLFVRKLKGSKSFDEVKVPLEDAHVTEELRRFIYSVAGKSDMAVKLGQ
jgi:hypothetical protein